MIDLSRQVYTALIARVCEIRQEGERGDNPVPTAIIIVGLALLAVALVAWAGGIVRDEMARVE